MPIYLSVGKARRVLCEIVCSHSLLTVKIPFLFFWKETVLCLAINSRPYFAISIFIVHLYTTDLTLTGTVRIKKEKTDHVLKNSCP